MGQLIKIQDFISRYESDMYRYPSQYIRLKRKQWEGLKLAWQNGTLDSFQSSKNQEAIDNELSWFDEEEKHSLFNSFKHLFRRRGKNGSNDHDWEFASYGQVNSEELDGRGSMSPSFYSHPETLEELKVAFLESLFKVQIKWASSTIREKSFVDRQFYFDDRLTYFLQRFPDTYLLMYKPIFLVKNAPVEVEVILISPTQTLCIAFLESEQNSVFLGANERFWTERQTDKEKKVLNPLIALNRMEKIVKNVYSLDEIDHPVKKIVLNRTGYIDFSNAPYDINIIDKRNYEEWFSSLRNISSPLKHVQLKAAQSLLQFCQSTFVKRPEWEEDETDDY